MLQYKEADCEQMDDADFATYLARRYGADCYALRLFCAELFGLAATEAEAEHEAGNLDLDLDLDTDELAA